MITKERLLETYSFDGSRFFYKLPARGGREAGYNVEGYRYMMVDLKPYPTHHLVWLMHHGELPEQGYDVDHINMDRSDNRIENLRLATRSQNMMNMPAHVDSKSGIKGVSWREDTKKWSVRVTIGNGVYKSFGSYDNLELAELVAQEAREKYHGEFARHVC
jgi:hypothetical protein